jgi:hypothetical protein
MAISNRAHLDDLTFDRLQPSLGMKDAGFAHPVILVDGEQFFRDFRVHKTSMFEEYRIAALSARHTSKRRAALTPCLDYESPKNGGK